ncbi:hypothetical protein [Lactococcus garvieae]
MVWGKNFITIGFVCRCCSNSWIFYKNGLTFIVDVFMRGNFFPLLVGLFEDDNGFTF